MTSDHTEGKATMQESDEKTQVSGGELVVDTLRPATAIVRVDQKHQLVVSVAVPIQRVRSNVGVLLLSTQPGDIDQIATSERWGILRIALVAAAVQIILSLLLAGTIAGPLRRLAGAAE